MPERVFLMRKEQFQNLITSEFTPSIQRGLENIATSLIEESGKVQPGQNVLIWHHFPRNPLIDALQKKILKKGATVSFYERNLKELAEFIPALEEGEIKEYLRQERNLVSDADFIIRMPGSETPEAMKDIPAEKMNVFKAETTDIYSGLTNYVIFYWPTRYETQKEGLHYEDYLKVVIEACNQPWEGIKHAQEKLIRKLDKGKKLTLIANEDDPDSTKRTLLEMSIEGMTFVNSTIARNYPGSEVFSAPVLRSVQGQMFAPGEYLYENKLMKDILLIVKDGKVIEASAKEGDKGLQEALSRGEGARYFGEIGIGTNPGLSKRLFNPLLNEKVRGSFHMALGYCPEYNEYLGKPVNVNNGNTKDKTPNHWDITILMHRNTDGFGGGRIILDDKVIQEDGFFLDPDLEVLNGKNDSF